MANWKEDYQRKLTTFEGAAKSIKSHDYICASSGTACISPQFFNELFKRADELEGVTIQEGIQVRPYPFLDPATMKKLDGRINHESAFATLALRKGFALRTTDFLPTGAYDATYRNLINTTVVTIIVTPPNKHGYFNLGLSAFCIPDLIKGRGKESNVTNVIVEVNDQMPVCFGEDMWIHVSQVDHIIENSSPIPVTSREPAGEIEATIGKYVLDLIEDGATIQMGWGGVTETVVAGLDGFHDLGIHSEMIPAGLDKLVEKGIVNNSKKPVFKGLSVATTCFGDADLYDYVSENPSVSICSSNTTNSIAQIAQYPKMLCINGALAVNLNAEIAAHGAGHTMISGPGGQLEFMIGASYSNGGKAVNLMPSTRKDKNGKVYSNIVITFEEGTPVTVPAIYADYVVTEYGIAHLRLKNRRQRALELINIAHPDFRGELRKGYEKYFAM